MPVPTPTPNAIYTLDLYSNAVRYQDPDQTACAPTSTQMMLNFTAANGTRGAGFRWAPSTSYSTERSILAWSRAHDTLVGTAAGTDPHGWRNALNYYGWGGYTSAATMTYMDTSYTSYAAAMNAAVRAMARFRKPVGMLAWAGGHSQILNGYEVFGQDPATSSDFTVVAVYLTDSLAKHGLRNARVTSAQLASGSRKYRFTAYAAKDSPTRDAYSRGVRASYLEWYGKWVIVAPVR